MSKAALIQKLASERTAAGLGYAQNVAVNFIKQASGAELSGDNVNEIVQSQLVPVVLAGLAKLAGGEIVPSTDKMQKLKTTVENALSSAKGAATRGASKAMQYAKTNPKTIAGIAGGLALGAGAYALGKSKGKKKRKDDED